MKLLLGLFCLLSLAGMAQEADFSGTIKWSELFPISKRGISPKVIGQDSESIYITRYVKTKRFIEKYNLATLALEKSIAVELTYHEDDLQLTDQLMFGGQPTLLTQQYDKKARITTIYMITIDPSSLALSTPKKIGEITYPKLGNTKPMIMSRQEAIEFLSTVELGGGVLVSPDRELAFMQGSDPSLTEAELEAGTYRAKGTLLDSEGEIVAESVYKMPFDLFYPYQTALSDDGAVYMLGCEMVPDPDAKGQVFGRNKVKINSVHMLVLDVESGEIFDYPLDMQGRIAEMMAFDFTQDGGVNIGGLFSTDGNGVKGSFFMSLDKDFNEIASEVNDFETDFITASWSEKKKEDLEKKKDKGKEKEEPELYNYYIDHLISKPDGSCLMLAEQYYVRVVTRTYTNAQGGTTTTTTTYYYYNDIIAVNFGKDGDVLWKKTVNKRQLSTNDGGFYLSYFVVPEGNDVHIIYNDREANYVDTENMSAGELKAVKKSTIGAKVTLSADGTVTKEKLFEFEENGLKLVPKICAAAGEKVVFLYARSPKGDKVGVINFDN
jgi:hypothetical protein